jgi:hypothetical protein
MPVTSSTPQITTPWLFAIAKLFKGRSEAREFFRRRDKSELCAAIVSEFGPRGMRFPGLVRSGR